MIVEKFIQFINVFFNMYLKSHKTFIIFILKVEGEDYMPFVVSVCTAVLVILILVLIVWRFEHYFIFILRLL